MSRLPPPPAVEVHETCQHGGSSAADHGSAAGVHRAVHHRGNTGGGEPMVTLAHTHSHSLLVNNSGQKCTMMMMMMMMCVFSGTVRCVKSTSWPLRSWTSGLCRRFSSSTSRGSPTPSSPERNSTASWTSPSGTHSLAQASDCGLHIKMHFLPLHKSETLGKHRMFGHRN